MKNRIKNFDNNGIPDEPEDLLEIISGIIGGVLNQKLFDFGKNADEMKLYEEELKKVINKFPVKICEKCGNPYYIIKSNKITTTFHPSGLACHWCNFNIYNSYYYYLRNIRASRLGTFAEKNIYN
jgi:hypothetical protein